MEIQLLEDLEKRINKAIEVIVKLRSENQYLKEENEHLLAKLKEQEINIERLHQRFNEMNESESDSGQLSEKMQYVKEKIIAIIARLDDLEPLV